jgi:DNA-binding NtrC family response regulator
MAVVWLHIEDTTDRLTLKAILESEGHQAGGSESEVAIADSPERAEILADRMPTLLLSTFADLPRALEAMRRGVFGYILRPFQPGEAALMVKRALAVADRGPAAASVQVEYAETKELVPLAAVEREHIERVLRACRQNHTRAAHVLGIGRNTLWRKLKKYEAEDQSRPPYG